LEEAENYAKAALEEYKGIDDSYYLLGLIEEKKGNKEKSLSLYKDALSVDPANIDARRAIESKS
jgi:tetratricopeptide (TPR) repeat protein